MKKLLWLLYFIPTMVWAQRPSLQPTIESRELKSEHFAEYGRFYIYGGLALMALFLIGYLLNWDRKLFPKRKKDDQDQSY